MAVDQRQALSAIKRFDQLIAYLRDELGWPINKDSFDDVDDLFYDFSAEELGIEPKTAAKIQEIKRLRPLSTKQPWGIFFVKFEPKKLPIVALRRILGQVARKKRASSNSSERTAWSADDLLFISNYGEGEERQISLAHFSQPNTSDLPTLRVLGWNNLDTPLHLDGVANELTQNLKWPEDDENLDLWRSSWSNAFKLGHNEVINTAKDLSIRLAELASNIRNRIKAALAIENEFGPLTKLMKAFQSSLVHDLSSDGFADMYAQTIAYGLLSARITDPSKKTVDDFTSHMRTSPFLKELMETFLHVGGRKGKADTTGIDFDELGVGDVIQLLDAANMEAVVRDFGDRNRQEDPVMHFFEGFLQVYDSQIRKDRGVFYTPQPIVSYVVRSVHELLQDKFGLADGLADTVTWGEMLKKHQNLKLPFLTNSQGEIKLISPDEPFVQILDPATGTATFIVETIEVIHQTLLAKWTKQGLSEVEKITAWNNYVPKHLLPRLHAYELMMAPYAIAHMKIGLKLSETGYKFESEERARVYLTNALEPWQEQIVIPDIEALAHEARAVNDIKRYKKFTIIIGNPPYAGHSANNDIRSIVDLVRDYTKDVPELLKPGQGKWLQDDYVKFIRYAQDLLLNSKIGIFGFVTNHSFIDNPTFRGMRSSLKDEFSFLHILDMHGNSTKREIAPDGSADENVFDIKQGVCITLATKLEMQAIQIKHSDLFGKRDSKYYALNNLSFKASNWKSIEARPSFYLFKPENGSLAIEYEKFFPLPLAMNLNGDPAPGIVTTHDEFAISWSKKEAMRKTRALLDSKDEAEARKEFRLCSQEQWNYDRAKAHLGSNDWEKNIGQILYRPFDQRWTVYDSNVAVHQRLRVTRHFFGKKNLAICVGKAGQVVGSGEWNLVSCTRNPVDFNFFYRGGACIFPLNLLPEDGNLTMFDDFQPNFSNSFLQALSLKVLDPSLPKKAIEMEPEKILGYIYAILHSPDYRKRYSDFLKIDFPKIPITKVHKLFLSLSSIGQELISLHLLESPTLHKFKTHFKGNGKIEVEKISWSDNTVWIDKNKTTGFAGVTEEVWNFHVGGYQVCHKWLKDRKEYILSEVDIEHYQKIIAALSASIDLMEAIDLTINEYGGWPLVFIEG
jgi:predicted helicase